MQNASTRHSFFLFFCTLGGLFSREFAGEAIQKIREKLSCCHIYTYSMRGALLRMQEVLFWCSTIAMLRFPMTFSLPLLPLPTSIQQLITRPKRKANNINNANSVLTAQIHTRIHTRTLSLSFSPQETLGAAYMAEMKPLAFRYHRGLAQPSSVAPSLRRCFRALLISHVTAAAPHTQRAAFVIPPVERLTRPSSPRLSNNYLDTHRDSTDDVAAKLTNSSAGGSRGGAEAKQPFHFAVQSAERGLFDHGVTPEAKGFIAEAEADYRASSAYLHDLPGGPGLPESETYTDEATGQQVTRTRIAAPVGDTYVPSSKERFAGRGHTGELSRQQALLDKPYMLDEHAQLNLKKERQLAELLDSPMPALGKATEVAHLLLESVYPQSLALQPRTCESVMLLYSHASYLRRLEGPETASPTLQLAAGSPTTTTTLTAQDVPFLFEMRRLYSHQKRCFVSPTPLLLEHLMSTLSVVSDPSTTVFHLANRLLLDADKFVVLPTRTTYTAFFKVCQVNNAMPFALARYTDALQALQLPVDAPMLTALLKGLNESGYVEEAVALLARVEHVPVSTPLMNASLETLLLSDQALACFSLYDSMHVSSTRPNAETYTLLLLACEKSGQWRRVTSILSDMQHRRVKGDAQTLNLLLKGLLQEKLHSFARQLYQTMQLKEVPVWPALESGVRPLLR